MFPFQSFVVMWFSEAANRWFSWVQAVYWKCLKKKNSRWRERAVQSSKISNWHSRTMGTLNIHCFSSDFVVKLIISWAEPPVLVWFCSQYCYILCERIPGNCEVSCETGRAKRETLWEFSSQSAHFQNDVCEWKHACAFSVIHHT